MSMAFLTTLVPLGSDTFSWPINCIRRSLHDHCDSVGYSEIYLDRVDDSSLNHSLRRVNICFWSQKKKKRKKKKKKKNEKKCTRVH